MVLPKSGYFELHVLFGFPVLVFLHFQQKNRAANGQQKKLPAFVWVTNVFCTGCMGKCSLRGLVAVFLGAGSPVFLTRNKHVFCDATVFCLTVFSAMVGFLQKNGLLFAWFRGCCGCCCWVKRSNIYIYIHIFILDSVMLIERADAKPQLQTNVVKGWDEKLVETQVGWLT